MSQDASTANAAQGGECSILRRNFAVDSLRMQPGAVACTTVDIRSPRRWPKQRARCCRPLPRAGALRVVLQCKTLRDRCDEVGLDAARDRWVPGLSISRVNSATPSMACNAFAFVMTPSSTSRWKRLSHSIRATRPCGSDIGNTILSKRFTRPLYFFSKGC